MCTLDAVHDLPPCNHTDNSRHGQNRREAFRCKETGSFLLDGTDATVDGSKEAKSKSSSRGHFVQEKLAGERVIVRKKENNGKLFWRALVSLQESEKYEFVLSMMLLFVMARHHGRKD